ncbi:hypothetical protein [Bernardetia sp. MNP-M8]|uniref:hypothetical protein n=1 Tax=Bernardetia sp. MNP-M8 TaxID=3127470 RepID=UPI0030CED2F9
MIDKYTGSFHSPFFIFIKGLNHLSDIEILKLLELKNIEKRDFEKETECYLRITRDKEWVHIMDNWYYNLWKCTGITEILKQLGKKYDLLHASWGDSDYSFDFVYYKNGKLRRKYEAIELDGTSSETTVFEEGIPLEEENIIKREQLSNIIRIAKSIGIEINHKLGNIVCYQYEEPFIED